MPQRYRQYIQWEGVTLQPGLCAVNINIISVMLGQGAQRYLQTFYGSSHSS